MIVRVLRGRFLRKTALKSMAIGRRKGFNEGIILMVKVFVGRLDIPAGLSLLETVVAQAAKQTRLGKEP